MSRSKVKVEYAFKDFYFISIVRITIMLSVQSSNFVQSLFRVKGQEPLLKFKVKGQGQSEVSGICPLCEEMLCFVEPFVDFRFIRK